MNRSVCTALNPRSCLAALVAAGLFAALARPASAQVSLATVVDLAQRNSSAVHLAEADVRKAQASLSESKDVFIPSLVFGSGLPAFPSVGFTGSPSSIWTATVSNLVFSIPQKHYIDAARSGLRAATAALQDAREQSALDASSAYIELDTVNQELDAARQQGELAARLIEIEQQRTETGVDPLKELLDARLTAANIRLATLHLETRAGVLAKQLALLTGLPLGSILPDHASIPEIPKLNGEVPSRVLPAVQSAQFIANSKKSIARGDKLVNYLPQMSFGAQYNRNTTLLNNANDYYKQNLPPNNFSSGVSIQIPLFDFGHHAKARESDADALRAKVEAEQAEHQDDLRIAELTGNLKELDAQVEVANLKQQISAEQLKAVLSQLEYGNGAGSGPGAPAQLSPKDEQLTRIDERQKFEDSLEAGFDLARTRLGLLRALGHIQEWVNELHNSAPAVPARP